MTQPTPTCCWMCGATTPQEARAHCTRYSASDVCHGCELWPDEIAFDAPKPLTVEGVQALADEPPLIDTLALIGKVHCWPPSAVSITHALAEAILKHWQPPQPPQPAMQLLKRALDRLPCESDSDNALVNEIWNYLRKFPPCEDCGAMTSKEAETRCHVSSHKDECHGCDLWPDDDSALVQPQEPVDDAELRTVFANGAEARWREGFPDAWSLTDMERAAHTAGLRAVLARCGRSAEPVTPQPPSTEKLFHELDQLLSGIDRRVDHPEGGWWETDDGGRFGKIMLRKIKETISRHLIPPQP